MLETRVVFSECLVKSLSLFTKEKTVPKYCMHDTSHKGVEEDTNIFHVFSGCIFRWGQCISMGICTDVMCLPMETHW